MGIGTSLGAYFENDFTHQAGIEDKTHDPMERTPDQVDQNKQLEKQDDQVLGGTEVGLKGTALSDSLIKEFQAFRNLGKPYRDQRDGAIAPPEPPPPDNVTMIHPIGFKDRSQEPIDLNPMNDTENGVIGMGQTGGEGPSVFQSFMATRGRRQQSNITEHPDEVPSRPQEEIPTPATSRPADHPDFTRLVDEHYLALVAHSHSQGNEAWQPRGMLPNETLRQFAEREVNRADPDLRYQGHREPIPEPDVHSMTDAQLAEHWGISTHSEPQRSDTARMSDADFYAYGHLQEPGSMNPYEEARLERIDRSHRDQFEQVPFDGPPAFEHEPGNSIGSYAARMAREKLLDYKSSDAVEVKKGSVGLKVDSDNGYRQQLNFYHEPSNTVGSLDISERQGGKQLYVHGIGLGENISPNSLGKRAMRDLIEAIKEQYPKAETIKGFRVSGARAAVGQTGDAEMRIRPPRQNTQEDDISSYLGATNAHRY
jgi:hypothetical protein